MATCDITPLYIAVIYLYDYSEPIRIQYFVVMACFSSMGSMGDPIKCNGSYII